MRKYSHYLALTCIAGVWLASTAVSCHYSRKAWYERERNDAAGLAGRIESYFDSYKDLMASLYARYETQPYISRKDTELFLDAWRSYDLIKLADMNVDVVGWYSFRDPAKNSFMFVNEHKYGKRVFIVPATPDAEQTTKDADFTVRQAAPFLKIDETQT